MLLGGRGTVMLLGGRCCNVLGGEQVLESYWEGGVL